MPRYLIGREPCLKPKKICKKVSYSSSTPDKKTWLFSRFVISHDNPAKSFKSLLTIMTKSMSVR
jgi:hypothetical protein